MFPFTLDGPAFLGFYAALALVACIALWWAKRRLTALPPGGGGPGALQRLARDPYAIACLRSGPDESVRVAVVALVDRGALTVDDARCVATTEAGHGLQATDALERALLQACRADVQPASVLPREEGVRRSAAAIEAALQQQGLLVSPEQRRARARLAALAAALLLAVSAVRIVQTLMAGRSNLGFLIVLTVLALLAVAVLSQGRLTVAGTKQLGDVQGLLGSLRQRAATLKPGQSGRDMALLAGAFGLAVLPAAAFAFARELYPPPAQGGGSGGDSGGSSDSGSSSDGSGCGSSGCGGGGSSD